MKQPLEGDGKRQATAALRGYYYQVLRTIYEWLDLKEGDCLYLEGVEDFDRLTASEAQVSQVKHSDTTAAITLRSPAVVMAINSCWSLRRENPGANVRLNFLTTSAAGVEAGEPFGKDRLGLDVWSEASRSPADPAAEDAAILLSRFLIKEGRVSEDLLIFLQSATPEGLREQLFGQLSWQTNQPGLGDVEAALLSRLRSLCWRRNIPNSWAEKIRDRLVSAAWTAATRPEFRQRLLTSDDFYRHFEEATTVPVPAVGLPHQITHVLTQGIASVLGTGGGSSSLTLAGSISRVTITPPRC